MSISRTLGQKNQPPNALEATWKDPVAEKQAAKRRRKCIIWKDASRICIPQEEGRGARARAAGAGFFLFPYLSISTYPYNICISLSLSLFEQVKLLEKAKAGARMRYETATRFLRLLKEYETNPRGCLRCPLLGAAP